jgi:hypothetical protein
VTTPNPFEGLLIGAFLRARDRFLGVRPLAGETELEWLERLAPLHFDYAVTAGSLEAAVMARCSDLETADYLFTLCDGKLAVRPKIVRPPYGREAA